MVYSVPRQCCHEERMHCQNMFVFVMHLELSLQRCELRKVTAAVSVSVWRLICPLCHIIGVTGLSLAETITATC